MLCLLFLELLMCNHGSVTQAIYQTVMEYHYIPRSIQDDLKLLNLSCEWYDSCAQRNDDSLNPYACHCDPYCVQTDTCCIDSPYIASHKPKVRSNCRSVHNGKTFFMVDRCPSGDSTWDSLCRNEWNGEDNTLRIVPVTSLRTSITYKNYFCFKCHEANEDFVRWKVKLDSNAVHSRYSIVNKRVSLTYDGFRATWIAVIDDFNGGSFPVNISIESPENILVRNCDVNVISSCSKRWRNKEVIDKCKAYTAMKKTNRNGFTITYRNIHCAVCNFEIIDSKFSCGFTTFTTLHPAPPFLPPAPPLLPPAPSQIGHGFAPGARLFSFTHILDIERYDRDRVGKMKQCDEDSVWDPYADKCAQLACALPGYSLRNGKCVIAG